MRWSNIAASNALLAVMLILAAIALGDGARKALINSQDFQWSGARLLLHRQDPYKTFVKHVQGDPTASRSFILTQAPNYQVTALGLLIPYAALPWTLAKITWAISNAVFIGLILYALRTLLMQEVSWRVFILVSLAFIACTPTRVAIGNGQHSLISIAFFVLALMAESRERPVLATIALSIAWFKYTVTFPLTIIFVVKRRWDILIGATVIQCIGFALLSIWLDVNPITLLLEPFKVNQLSTQSGYTDFFALATRLGITHREIPLAATAAITALVIVRAMQIGTGNSLRVLSVLSILSILWTFHLYYDTVVLIFPLCYLVMHWERGNSPAIARTPIEAAGRLVLLAAILCSWVLDWIVWGLGKAGVPGAQAVIPTYNWIVTALYMTALIFLLFSPEERWNESTLAACE